MPPRAPNEGIYITTSGLRFGLLADGILAYLAYSMGGKQYDYFFGPSLGQAPFDILHTRK